MILVIQDPKSPHIVPRLGLLAEGRGWTLSSSGNPIAVNATGAGRLFGRLARPLGQLLAQQLPGTLIANLARWLLEFHHGPGCSQSRLCPTSDLPSQRANVGSGADINCLAPLDCLSFASVPPFLESRRILLATLRKARKPPRSCGSRRFLLPSTAVVRYLPDCNRSVCTTPP